MRLALALAVALGFAGAAEALYQMQPLPLREAGVLTCKPDIGDSSPADLARHVSCAFDRVGLPGPERYTGRMNRAGAAATVPVMSWVVWTPGGISRDGMLTGMFIASLDEDEASGFDSRVLRSDGAGYVVLQPVRWTTASAQEDGLAIAMMELRPALSGKLG